MQTVQEVVYDKARGLLLHAARFQLRLAELRSLKQHASVKLPRCLPECSSPEETNEFSHFVNT